MTQDRDPKANFPRFSGDAESTQPDHPVVPRSNPPDAGSMSPGEFDKTFALSGDEGKDDDESDFAKTQVLGSNKDASGSAATVQAPSAPGTPPAASQGNFEGESTQLYQPPPEGAPPQRPGAPSQPPGPGGAPSQPPGPGGAPSQPPGPGGAPSQPPGSGGAPSQPPAQAAQPPAQPPKKSSKGIIIGVVVILLLLVVGGGGGVGAALLLRSGTQNQADEAIAEANQQAASVTPPEVPSPPEVPAPPTVPVASQTPPQPDAAVQSDEAEGDEQAPDAGAQPAESDAGAQPAESDANAQPAEGDEEEQPTEGDQEEQPAEGDQEEQPAPPSGDINGAMGALFDDMRRCTRVERGYYPRALTTEVVRTDEGRPRLTRVTPPTPPRVVGCMRRVIRDAPLPEFGESASYTYEFR